VIGDVVTGGCRGQQGFVSAAEALRVCFSSGQRRSVSLQTCNHTHTHTHTAAVSEIRHVCRLGNPVHYIIAGHKQLFSSGYFFIFILFYFLIY